MKLRRAFVTGVMLAMLPLTAPVALAAPESTVDSERSNSAEIREAPDSPERERTREAEEQRGTGDRESSQVRERPIGPAQTGGAPPAEGGTNTVLALGGGAAALLVGAGGYLALRRRESAS